MTKRDLINLLQELECDDETPVYVLDSYYLDYEDLKDGDIILETIAGHDGITIKYS